MCEIICEIAPKSKVCQKMLKIFTKSQRGPRLQRSPLPHQLPSSCLLREVRNTGLFAQEVQVDAFMTIDRMQAWDRCCRMLDGPCHGQEEIKSTAEVADAMSEARSRWKLLRFIELSGSPTCSKHRFEALHKVGASRTIKGISEASFQTALWRQTELEGTSKLVMAALQVRDIRHVNIYISIQLNI